MRTTIIIAQYGRPQLTISCVHSLRRHHGERPEIVIVDDGSRAEDVEQVSMAGLGNVELIRRPHRGVTAAWNAGAARSSADVLVFLNNDVVTTGPWAPQLTSTLADERVVVAGVARRRERFVDPEVLGLLPTRFFAAGWCFAVRRDDFESVNGFRECLRLYYSDTDLQARLLDRRGSGPAGIGTMTGLPLRHLGHATTSQCVWRNALWQADRRRFERLWRSGLRHCGRGAA